MKNYNNRSKFDVLKNKIVTSSLIKELTHLFGADAAKNILVNNYKLDPSQPIGITHIDEKIISKLNPNKKTRNKAIIELRKQGRTIDEIAEKSGLSTKTIWSVCHKA